MAAAHPRVSGHVEHCLHRADARQAEKKTSIPDAVDELQIVKASGKEKSRTT